MKEDDSLDETGAPKRHAKLTLHLDVLPAFSKLINRSQIRRLVGRVLSMEGIEGSVEVGLAITDDEHIRALNAEFRGVDRPTDVLSFPMESGPGETFVTPPGHVRALGDIVISYERAVEQAREYGHSVEREIGYLVVHGMLHLLGYDHATPHEREVMRAKEEAALVDLPRCD